MGCERCGRLHQSEDCKQSIVFQDYVFAPPYLCMCCGSSISARQWLLHHTCEACEWGNCATPQNWHPKPSWVETEDGTEAFELYVQYTEAIPRPRAR
jgi:hypothetical protein